MKLVDILEKYSLSGDSTYNGGTDKNTYHSYIEFFYEKCFEKYKEKNISLLEIGIQGGSSLKLWKEYFVNSKRIVGIDISEDSLAERNKNIEGVEYFFGDAYSEEIANQFSNFDIIIDDGPHTLESQIQFILKYFPKLNSGGMLIIEDVEDINYTLDFMKTFHKVCENDKSGSSYIIKTIDLRNKKGRYDDILFVVAKK